MVTETKKQNHSTIILNNNKPTNKMKKLSSLIIALFVSLSGNCFCSSNTADIDVTAEVLAELNVTGTDVSFGNVQQGSAAQVQANTNDTANPNSNASAPISWFT
ncbi:hypothetical protein [Rhodohalobacter sp.]|uniref:hypothetical protein n=1 Tax=Rhodohalobacter sp. TaxID=1974210 RepID=UPI002ACEF5BB|nr:hypothetical protein [Rhodohalobacter sp.]MDZ7757836.1 hypothetical protein [Rhodohalobacter sp.]